MSLQFREFLERLALLSDPEDLCDLLGITSEDIIDRFGDLIEFQQEILRDAFDIPEDTEED